MSVKDSHAQDLLVLLRGNDVDRKIAEFNTIKGMVKHHAVQSEAINPMFQACEIAIQSSNNTLSTNALGCLKHLIKRISLQEPARLRPQGHHLLPLLVEKLGDMKDRNRAVAMISILEMFRHCPTEVEKYLKEVGFASKNPRIRQEAIACLMSIHTTVPSFAFRSYTPFLMEMLEDASELVREAAKNAVVDLFKNAPEHAKSDLKKELQKRQVRKGIATYIVSQLGLPIIGADFKGSVISMDGHEDDATAAKNVSGSTPATGSGSMASCAQITSLPGTEMEDLEPLYVNTNRELEDIFHCMVEPFDGRESEHNWLNREKNITKLRQLARGNAYRDFQTTFQAGIKSLLDGILKTVNSLRTTVSTNGGQLIKDLAIVMGSGLDAQVEILLANFVKLCAGTKKITSQLGQIVVAVILANVSYHPKILQHIWGACSDKNVSPRSYAPGWILVILETHADHKGYMEHSGGVDIIEKCLRRGLADANPGVRESMRKTYWRFQTNWPDRAEKILESLDGSHRKLLEKANPNGPSIQKSTTNLRPSALGQSATAPARTSIKEAILAQKRSKHNLKATVEPIATVPTKKPAPQSTAPSGLSSAPVRRPHLKTKPVPDRHDRAVLDPERATYVRATSPTTTAPSSRSSPGRGNGSQTPPPSPPIHRLARGITPGRTQSPLIGNNRTLTVLEQLTHNDWRIRVEGVVTVACILAKRTPPNHDGQKMPTLPPSDVFAPTLVKLFNDPQQEVVENLLAPEVLAELAKIVPMEQIVPKVILHSEGDYEQHAQPINPISIQALKRLMSESDAAELLFKIVTSMGTSSTATRKLPLGTITPLQKRKITHGCLLWMNELVKSHISGATNSFFNDANYKSIVNRLIAMISTAKSSTQVLLASVLKNLEMMNPDTFSKILSTFEAQTVKELRKGWGMNVGDHSDTILQEERVAGVEQVLGSRPQISNMLSNSHTVDSTSPVLDDFMKHEDVTLMNPTSSARPTTPPQQSLRDQDTLRSLPPLPATPENDLASVITHNTTTRKTARPDDLGPTIEVYQDPINESNSDFPIIEKGVPTGNDWHRSKLRKQISNSNLPRTPGDSTRLLTTTIGRLQARDMDTQAFRKLIGIARENPVRAVLQEQNGEELYDIWQGGHVFEELLTALLEYLTADDIGSDRAGDLRVQGLLVLKQLLIKAAPYFAHYEPQILSTLISVRGRYPSQSHITSGLEEISEEYMQIADPQAGIDAILDITIPKDNPRLKQSTPSWCMSLSCLAVLVRASKLSALETQLARLGQLAVKSLDDEDSEVRRSCVAMCIEVHSKLNDDERLFDDIFKGMKSGHQNLLAYYFAKRESEHKQ
ncbi:clasp N terminal-domain-containing protein [Geopyxis carbonaria]|nr:clasp N terminal-domain-containing protein [Geopyxis carbonaria]